MKMINESTWIRMCVGVFIASASSVFSVASFADVPVPGANFPAIEILHVATSTKVPVVKLGTVTMVNLWATWCEACKVELSEMEKNLLPITSGPGRSKLDLKFVSLDKEPAKAQAWFKQNTTATEVMLGNLYSDAGFELAEKLEADSFPMTVVIGKDGKIIHVERGFKAGQAGSDQVKKIAALLKSAL